MNIFKITSAYYNLSKLICNASHKIQKITENDLLGFNYDNDFAEIVLEKYPYEIIKKMLKYGDLRLGLLLKRLEGEEGLFDLWLEQYSKIHSPLGYYKNFEEPIEKEYGKILDNIFYKIKYS